MGACFFLCTFLIVTTMRFFHLSHHCCIRLGLSRTCPLVAGVLKLQTPSLDHSMLVCTTRMQHLTYVMLDANFFRENDDACMPGSACFPRKIRCLLPFLVGGLYGNFAQAMTVG